MYSHMMVGSNDIDRSKTFYDATFKAIGGKEAIVDEKGRLMYLHNGGAFLVTPAVVDTSSSKARCTTRRGAGGGGRRSKTR